MRIQHLSATWLAVLSLAACAAEPVAPDASNAAPALAASTPEPAAAAASSAASTPAGESLMSRRVGEAVITPFSDLNLAKTTIPQVLKEAYAAPYALPIDTSCLKLIEQVQALDAVLGADLDTPPSATNPSLIERGMGEVGNASVSALRSTAEGVLPFRGWIRKLTGAERHSRRVAAAITAGSIRRAYLKGLGHAKGCAAPAAPIVAPAVSPPPRP